MSSADNTPAFDATQLALMTPEEREAITDTAYSPDELATMGKLAAGAVEDEGDPDEVLDEHGRPVETVIEPANKAAAAGADAATKTAAEALPVQDAAPVASSAVTPATYKSTLPEDFDQKVEAAQQKIDAIWAEFDGGGMERSVLQTRLREAETEKSGLDALRLKSEISNEMSVQAAQSAWQKTIDDLFKSSAQTGGVDYANDAGKRTDLDQFVKALANDAANEDKPMGWFLSEADKRVRALHGVAPAAKTDPVPAPKKDAVAEATDKRKPPLSLVPKTLAHVPGGDGPGDVGSEFEQLDGLEGEDLENAVARLSPSQREKFARGG